MKLRIETSVNGKSVTFVLSGRFDAHGAVELRRLFEDRDEGKCFIVDLRDVRLIDRPAVKFLLSCLFNEKRKSKNSISTSLEQEKELRLRTGDEIKKMNEQNTIQTTLADDLKSAAGLSTGIAILMIVGGLLAIFNPFAVGLGISTALGWLIVFGGILHGIYAFAAGGVGGFLWRTLVGILYVVGGFYLVLNPQIALASLTLVVGIILIAEAVLQFIAFYQVRETSGSGWILYDGIVTLLLAILILYPFPGSSTWAVGTIFGVNLLSSGFSRLMYSIAARKIFSSATA